MALKSTRSNSNMLDLHGGSTSCLTMNPVNAYNTVLTSHPLITNMMTAGALSVVSDAVTQRIEREKNINIKAHSYYRSTTMFIYGFIISGGLVSKWFRFLNALFPTSARGPPLRVGQKLFVNQVVMSPILNGLFFSWVVMTRNLSETFQKRLTDLRTKLATDLVPTMARSCLYWGIMNTANFTVVPISYQLLYTQVGFLLWTSYLSFVGYRAMSK